MFKAVGMFLLVMLSGCVTHSEADAVFMIEDAVAGGSGTGFCVDEGLLLTNEHVCRGMIGMVLVGNSVSKPVYWDITKDLCLVKTTKCTGFNSVLFADNNGRQNEKGYVIGHPAGITPQLKTDGYIGGKEDMPIVIEDIEPEYCQFSGGQPMSRQMIIPIVDPKTGEISIGLKTQFGCAVVMKQYHSSIPVIGGSSGSPVFNSLGEVIGVINKTLAHSTISLYIPNSTVQEFLKAYKAKNNE